MNYAYFVLYLLCGYLIGSIPPAYILGRIVKKIDIREHGSGNVGFTNALRVLGVVPGVTTLVIDIVKGFLPVWLIGYYGLFVSGHCSIPVDVGMALCGIAVISGHNWPVYIGFKGGKGVATGCGVFLAIAPFSTLLTVSLWIIVLALFKIVSIASIIAVSVLPVIMILLHESPVIIMIAVVLAFVIVIRHRENIKRLLKGEERSFRKNKNKSAESEKSSS
ncbi:MAG: glycerol-3-phosphate 1-O-acyltransferase PlsY [Candidatus Auribacterota bacterium]|jgi:glycerol-3-phosphate acyltransferase PlsY|nr:glycerol-3-phosphate 1-O-acyltransferase PlsY [Candidatus Auribacterota bacterium]